MTHYTLIARINAGDGKFPFVNVQFSKNHRPIPIEGATYYLRPGNRGRRTPIRIGRELHAAVTALLNLENGKAPIDVPVFAAARRSEEHTSELQSRRDLVCRLLLEKKKQHKHLSWPAHALGQPQ